MFYRDKTSTPHFMKVNFNDSSLNPADFVRNIGNLSSRLFEGLARIILSLLIVTILIAMIWAILKTLTELQGIFSKDIHEALKVVMLNSLTILALLEVFRTALAYFSEGRVKVTYIIDTVLVVILTEIMVFWFKEIEYSKILMVIALMLSLLVARIIAIRFSPTKKEDLT